MSRSVKLFAVAVLAIVLTLSSAQNAFAVTELAYDNGQMLGGTGDNYEGVRFSLPSGASSGLLRYVRWETGDSSSPLTIHITGPDHLTDLPGSPINLPGPGGQPVGTGCPSGWTTCHGYDLTSLGIVVTGDFYVILFKSGGSPTYDSGVSSGRSLVGATLAGLAPLVFQHNLLIRVDIDPTYPPASSGGPVGGFIEPVNNLTVAAPYLALFGIVVAVAVVVWKKREN